MTAAAGLVVGPVDPILSTLLAEAGVEMESIDPGTLDAGSRPRPDVVVVPLSVADGSALRGGELRRRFPDACLVLLVPQAEKAVGAAIARELGAELLTVPIERRPAVSVIERALAVHTRRRQIQELADRIRTTDPEAAAAVAALADEIADKTRAVDDALAFRTSALANLVHEVRTPLTVLQGFTDLLEDDVAEVLDADQLELIRGVRHSATQLGRVVQSLVDLARAETGRLDPHTSSVFLPDLLADVGRGIEREVAKRTLRFALDVDRRLGWIRTEPDWLRQILSCLLSNAIKFTSRGEVRLLARRVVPESAPDEDETAFLLRAPQSTGDQVEIEVRDTGSGIPPNEQSRIFEAFHQRDASTTRSHEGLGIGLTVVRELATALGASLELDSRPGEGTSVRIRLALDQPAPVVVAAPLRRAVAAGALPGDGLSELATLHRLAPARFEEAVPLALRALERSLGASLALYAVPRGSAWQVVEAIGDTDLDLVFPRDLLDAASRQGRATREGDDRSKRLVLSLRDGTGHRFGVLGCGVPDGREDSAWLTLQAVGGWLAGVRTALALSAERVEIASVLTRSVKDPLGALLAYTQVLLRGLRGPLGPEQRTIVLRLEKGIHRAILAALDLLDYERSQRRSFETARSAFSVAKVVEHVLTRHAAALELAHVRVERDVPGDLPACRGDEIRTDRAISALLRSLVDASPDGSVVAFQGRSSEEFVRLSLRAPVPDPRSIREALIGSEASPALDEHLGLALARSAIEAQGGTIDVATPDGTTLVTLTLPRGA